MCHDTDSRPPAPPVRGAVAAHGPLQLTSTDGSPLPAYQATPAAPRGANVVILPDVRGVHPYYQDLARRFAEAGFGAVALDYYGRTAPDSARDDDFDWQALLPAVRSEEVAEDVRAAVAHLAETAPGPVFTVGFCFGGSQSWRLAASDVDLAGVIGLYGQPKLVRDVLPELARPMLLLVAGEDVATTPADSARFAEELAEVGVPHRVRVYLGAPHSFFDRGFAEWRDACDDVWRRILDFTDEHAGLLGV